MTQLKRPGTAVEELVDIIRERIITGEYKPGFRLSQQHLAEEFEVSRTPLREALQRLSTEGLVLSLTNRGMEVAPATLTDVEGSYALRLLVEPAIIAAIAITATDQDVEQMAAALAVMEGASVSTTDFQRAHLDYHAILLSHYPKASAGLTKDLHTQIRRHQRLYFSRPLAAHDFTSLDRIFLEAVTRRDGEVARHVLEAHLIDACLGMVRAVEPDHLFAELPIVLHGLAIEFKGDLAGAAPVEISWTDGRAVGVPALHTSNLTYLPPN